MYDAVMIGSGPAGLSAALYTSRANLTTLVIGKDRGALEKADRIENYFGMAEPISGCELVENTKTQARSLGVELVEDEIFHITWNGHFILEGKNGTYESLTVLLATGTGRKTLKIEGLKELEGRGVSYCAVCDAFFYRGKEVAVLGNEDYAIHEMSQILPVVKSAVLLTNGRELKTEVPEGVQVIREPLRSVDGTERVEGITFEDGSSIAVEGLFVALGSAGAMELARKAGAFTEGQNIKVNERMETNIPGLYAAGDCIGGLLQISTAVGEGAQAAMSMIPFVRRQRKEK
ncbi:MAG: NAD(P)/FAD-dependent oxidoreductase [Lachnospiraceae bacterium]|jgi:thioredoxin reductase (NADPH)|nr:NAD(P)/FAD-dependent oxidoreductase [Lachnospiraceae bacterium]MCI9018217.1 NAD(P)/FAD-dependent oxidoreductase [Lachnospiraceae bacterium]MCI9681948.1 NAD(P)/FAD-dependent oxidoreductase [Lachnospiraceae bacterium]